MVPVIFMGLGGPKRRGFKVTVWWQQATKGNHLLWGGFNALDTIP